jgi:hypothetical protein
MNMQRSHILAKLALLEKWIEQNEYRAYDPFDGLSSKLLEKMTFGNHYLRICVQQAVRRFPINLRPLFGIAPQTSTKGMGFCAIGYLKLFQNTGIEDYLEKAKKCLGWLKENFSEGYSGHAWGNHFSYESRGGGIKTGVPTIVWTSLIAHAFMDSFEITGNEEDLDVAKSTVRFIMQDINAYESKNGNICFMYIPGRRARAAGCIHNSNVLGASILARVNRYAPNPEVGYMAKKSIDFTVGHQTPEGAWYYGEPRKFRWIDIFHTGYVLESIHTYLKSSRDASCKPALQKGYKYFVDTFFLPDGTPRYYHNRTYPIDIQSASQGIQTLVNLREYDPRSIDVAKKVTDWTLRNMQDNKGYFYFRKYPLMVNKTPMFHWGQATMLSGLAHLVTAI